MKKTLFILIALLVCSTSGISQTKKIKIKGDKSVHFVYEKDSSSLAHKENVKLVRAFYSFYKVIKEDNYQAYVDLMSPLTIKEIFDEKRQRKFKKFKAYTVNLFGKIKIRSIRAYPHKTFEENPVYVCVVQLPEGQSIGHRVGFDPLKRSRFEGVKNCVGLHMVSTDLGYKIVIPW